MKILALVVVLVGMMSGCKTITPDTLVRDMIADVTDEMKFAAVPGSSAGDVAVAEEACRGGTEADKYRDWVWTGKVAFTIKAQHLFQDCMEAKGFRCTAGCVHGVEEKK